MEIAARVLIGNLLINSQQCSLNGIAPARQARLYRAHPIGAVVLVLRDVLLRRLLMRVMFLPNLIVAADRREQSSAGRTDYGALPGIACDRAADNSDRCTTRSAAHQTALWRLSRGWRTRSSDSCCRIKPGLPGRPCAAFQLVLVLPFGALGGIDEKIVRQRVDRDRNDQPQFNPIAILFSISALLSNRTD
jgi:hypothetical protein